MEDISDSKQASKTEEYRKKNKKRFRDERIGYESSESKQSGEIKLK